MSSSFERFKRWFRRTADSTEEAGQGGSSAATPPPGADELDTVEVVGTEPEAELLCSLLRSAGVDCMHQLTDQGAGAFDGMAVGGPHEILVRAQDLESARNVLRSR